MQRQTKKLKPASPSPPKGQPGPTPAAAIAPPYLADDDGLRSPGERVVAAEGAAPIISTTLQSLYFVGRGEEAFIIALSNVENKVKAIDRSAGMSSEHFELVTCGQMFGAGKSQMGMRAIARANLPDVRDRLVAKFASPAEREVLDEYLRAITITVNLKETKADKDESPTLAHYLATALRHAIVDAKTREESLRAVTWETVPFKCIDIVAHVYACTQRALFVHWDEVVDIEYLQKLFPADARPNDSAIQAPLKRFYSPFWRELTPLLGQPHLFTFLTGKTQAFGLIGLQLLGNSSPSRHREVTLHALSVTDLDTAISRSTTRSCTPLTHWLTFASADLKALFLRRLDEETAGQPRLVHMYLEGMCQWLHDHKLVPGIDSEERVKELMQIGDGHADKKLTLVSHGPRGTGQLLSALIMAAMLGVSLSIVDRAHIWLEDARLPLLAVIDRFNLYACKVDSSEARPAGSYVRIRIADCLLRRISAAELCPELLIGHVPLSLLSNGDALDLLLRLRLVRALSMQCNPAPGAATWGAAVPAFASTLAGDQPLVSVNSPCTYCVPQIVTDARRTECGVPAGTSTAWDSPMHVSHLRKFFKHPGLLPDNAVGYPASESRSPDVLLRLKKVLVGFACKLGKTPTTWAVVQDEIDKAEPFIAASETPVCLVIVALTLGEEIREQFGSELLSWTVQGDNAHPTLKVPAGMQVVVLSRAGLCSLLGNLSVNAMAGLVEMRRDASVASAELSEVFEAMLGISMPAPSRAPPGGRRC